MSRLIHCGTVTYSGCLFGDVVMVPVLLLTLGPCVWRLVELCLCFFFVGGSYREVGAVMAEVLVRFGWRIVGMVN